MRSIRFQFIAFIMAVLLILLVLLNTYPLTSARDQIFEEKKVSLSGQAAVISSSLSALDNLSHDSVGEVLSFLDVAGLTRITVTDDRGVIVYDSTGPYGVGATEEAFTTALNSKTVFRSSFRNSAFESVAASPVFNQSRLIGAVGVYENDYDRAEMLLEMQTRIRIISFIIAGAALVIVAVFSEVLIRRLRRLVESIRTVAGGDYSHRMEVEGRDEISELVGEFNLLTERLDDTERQRRRFVSDASHELKTPLASIRLLADSIVQSKKIDPDTVKEFVSDIGNEAERLQHTTERLLDLSRLDDNIQIEPEPVDVKQTALDAFVMLRPLADEKGVSLERSLDDGCVIMANSDDLFHIIFNLMENAVKYNVPGGSVKVSCSSGESSVRLLVEDTGIGIPEEDRLNVFSRFYRVDKARSREAGGSGLGLSIVHDAVLAHGGTITIGSNKPQGTRFTVEFPKPTPEETGI